MTSPAILAALTKSAAINDSRETSTRIHNKRVAQRVAAIKEGDDQRAKNFIERSEIQAENFKLPLFPTTTIGSFPKQMRSAKFAGNFV